jgi:hypothetical protein
MTMIMTAAVAAPQLTQTQRKVFDQIVALREYTRSTGFKTTRSRNDLLQTLDGADLANVLLALKNSQQ